MIGPLIAAQVGQTALSIWQQRRAQKAAEEVGTEDRKLSQEELLLKLITEAAKIEDQNRYDEKRAGRMAPLAAARMESRLSPPKQTQLRNAAAGAHNAAQPGGGDPAVASLVTRNFSQYAQERAAAKQQGRQITPESLYTPQTNPLGAFKTEAPEAYLDWSGTQKYEDRSGDGLDHVEVAMLNKRLAEGATPQELAKMLSTFKKREVQGGISGGPRVR